MSEPATAKFPPFAVDEFLDHWFGGTRARPETIGDRMPWWFEADPGRDRRLARRWGAACRRAREGSLNGLADDPHGRLALILLLDQLPRSLYRGTSEAYAGDGEALVLCLDGHREGMDENLLPIEQAFFWMPLQHAEDLERQELGVLLFGGLADADPERRALWSGFAGYAERHRDIIEAFGRFPHRNAALGRATTEREAEWLERDGERFGQ